MQGYIPTPGLKKKKGTFDSPWLTPGGFLISASAVPQYCDAPTAAATGPEQADTSSEHADPPGQDSCDTDLSEASGVEDSDLAADFVFSRTGQTVAVFYDDDFHIGNVIDIRSDDLAEVKFMKKCVTSNNSS